MRPFLHILSLLLVLPVMALALAFVILGRVIAAGSWLGMLDQVLTAAVWLMPWGLLAIFASLLALAIGGMFPRTRWMAGLCVAILGFGSTLVVLVLIIGYGNFSTGQVPFMIPGAIAASIGAWLTVTERPSAGTPARNATDFPRTG
jgi:hypothetical protein